MNIVLINAQNTDFTSIMAEDVLKTAEEYRSDYSSMKRLISISKNTLTAIDAAYKTASGIYSETRGVIAESIYDMSKVEVALAIVEHDKSRPAIDRAAFEIARDAFVSGKVEERAQALADATGETQEHCLTLINRKLARMGKDLAAKTNKCDAKGELATPEEIKAAIIANGGRYLIQLPTGEGKTSKINEPVIRSYINAGKKVLVISHRRSINANLAYIDGIVSYADCKDPSVLEEAKGLKIVINSLAQNKYKEFIQGVDLLVIDEASQVISHVLGGEVKDREAVWDALNLAVKNAKDVIFTDADINSRCVDLIGDARFFKKEQAHSDITIRTSSADQVRGMAIAAAESSQTVLIACDVAKEARAIGKIIERKTGVTPLVITADNALWAEQAAFIANPNSKAHKVVIYSPVITSALSITNKHFKNHFGIFGGQVVPSDAIQMLRRDRTATEFVVGLRNPEYRKSEQVDVLFGKERARLAEAMTSAGLSEVMRAALVNALESTKSAIFETLRHAHCSAEAWLKDNVQNTLPATLIQQGFKVEVLEHNNELSINGFAAKSQGSKAVKKEIAGKLITTSKASTETIKKVENQGSVNEQEHLSVIRARAEDVLKRKELTEADALLWGQGEGELKVALFKKLYLGDKLEVKEAKVMQIITKAVSGMLLGKSWTSERSAEVIDQLDTMRHVVIGMGISLGKATTTKAKQAAMTRILSTFGIKTKKVDGGNSGDYYTIVDKSVEQMASYL